MDYQKTLYQKIIECLRDDPEQKKSAAEIAKWIIEHYPEDAELKKSTSTKKTDEELLKQYQAEVYENIKRIPKDDLKNIKITSDKPKRFYYTLKDDTQEIEEIDQKGLDNKISEQDLYPKLYEYLSTLDIYSKLQLSNSRNNMANKSASFHILGVKYSNTEIYNGNQIQEFLFKVKNHLDIDNINEVFSKTITIKNNLSINYAYLVAIDITPEALAKLRTYSDLGIGFIKLNYNKPEKSMIKISAEK